MKCKHCQSKNVMKAGFEYQATGKIQRIRCKDCFKISLIRDVENDMH